MPGSEPHVVLLKSQAKSRGGLEKSASRIAKAFADRGCKVSILTTEGGSELPTERRTQGHPISVHSWKTIGWPPFVRMEQFDRFVERWLKQNRVDLVFGMDRNRKQTHYRAGNGVHYAYLKSRLFAEGRMKYISCFLNPLHQKILRMERAAFENPLLKKLFTNSHMVKRQILERYLIDPKKIEVIHNGVEWKEMEGDFQDWPGKRADRLREFQLDPGSFQLLFIGNGYLRKGLGQLLEAMARLKRKDLQLSVIGKDRKQSFYVAKAAKLGLSKQVRFFGQQQETRLFYQFADALAIPSFYDPFANVTVEALAMGLFIVSSASNGGSEVLQPETGVVIEDLLSVDSLAASLETAMRHRKTISSAKVCRESVEHLDFSNQMNTLVEACLE